MAKRKKKRGGAAEKKAAAVNHRPSAKGGLPASIPVVHQALISIFILIAAICVLYPELVFENKLFVAGDVESALSLSTPIKKAMSEGEYPQWNPHLFSGMPSYGSMTYVPHVYPITVVTGFLITKLKFPNTTWLLFHIFFLGLGVWLILIGRGVNFLIAAGVGVMMMWMPNQVAVGANGHGSQASAVGYMPFALFFWDRLWRGKGVLLNASALTVLLGFQFLRSHLQISYYTFALIGMHVVFFGTLKIKDAFRGVSAADPPVFGFLKDAYERGASSAKRAALVDVGGAVGVLALIVLGALGISAVLFLPVHDYAQYSIRGAAGGGGLTYDYATNWSLHPAETLSFLVPFAFGFGKFYYFGHMPFTDYANYVGVIVAFFAVVAVLIARTRFTWFLVFVVAVTTLVAFGKHLPLLYGPLFKFLPYFNKFRVPVMVLIVQQLGLVLLCGIGLSAALKYDPIRGSRSALRAAIAAAAVLLIVLVTYSYWTGGFTESIADRIRNVRSVREQLELARIVGGHLFTDLVKFSVLFLVTASLVWAFFKRHIGALALVLAVLGVGMLDIYLVDRHIIYPEKLFRNPQMSIIRSVDDSNRVLEPDAVVEFLQKQGGRFRVFPMLHPSRPVVGDFETNRYMNFGISSIGGYQPAKLSIYKEFIDALDIAVQRNDYRMADMLNVRYLVTSNPLGEDPVFKMLWRGMDRTGREKFVYENTHALPRVFFVDRFEVRPGSQALQTLLADRRLDVSRTALLEKAPSIEPVSREGATAEITEYRFNEIRVQASLPSPALMVLGEIYYPGWQVEVDGEPGEIIRANHVLRAVALPAGDHDIVFRYDMSLLKKSLAVSVITFATALGILLFAVVFNLRGRMIWKRS